VANKRQEILLRANLGFVAMCLLGLSIVVRAGYIQMVQGEHYRSLADSLTIFPKTIFAERGNIYSENGRLLATTLPTFDVRIDFKTLQNNPELFKQHVDSISILLATTFGDKSSDQYKAELKKEYRKRSRYYLLKRNVTYNQMEDMKSWPLFRKGQYKSGMIAVQNDKRLMPFGLLAKRTIGFTNSDGRMVGLEGKYDEILKGTQGKVMVQKIAGGVTIPLDSKEQITPEPGHDIYTTLDIELQDVAEDALYRALQHHQAGHGCVVLMEVKTGKIKAIANLSTNKDSTYGENFNFAVGEATEPGSTFKLATVAALMEDGLVTADTKVDMGNGIATFYNLSIKDHEAPEIPVVTLQRAIEISSNVAVAKLAHANYSATPKKFYNHLEDFGFTKKIDIELSGAAQPKLADVKKWSGVSTAYLAHGYELQITPLHTLMFYNAIANNGTMVLPHLVDRIKSYNQTVDTINTTILKEDMLSESTVKQLPQNIRRRSGEWDSHEFENRLFASSGQNGYSCYCTRK
jgi:cell division protein FtsI (penicillin-binding protein 3)